jgi:hypothetical protein
MKGWIVIKQIGFGISYRKFVQYRGFIVSEDKQIMHMVQILFGPWSYGHIWVKEFKRNAKV